MATTKRAPDAPQWFRSVAYDAAQALDAGDWLLNLTLRRWLRDEPNPKTEDALRRVGPVLRRGDPVQVKAMHLDDDVHRWVSVFKASEWDGNPFTPHAEACDRPSLPPDVWETLQSGRIPGGIDPLKVTDLYTFERMLPAEIRAAGASCKPTDDLVQHPPAFAGTLDDAFGEGPGKQMVGRFVRVELSLPDDVLLADFADYLKHERNRLAAMGGPQPYREAARIKAKPASRLCATLASLRLLPYLDLVRWASREPKRSAGARLSDADLMALAGVHSSRRKELHAYARIAERQMNLRALFARLDRSAVLRPKRGKR